jgi:hypothetical protein
MSGKAMEWAIKLDPEVHKITSTQLAVLLALAFHYNDETGRCDPSYERIGRFARLTKRPVLNAINALAEVGIITITKRSRRTSYQYGLPGYAASSAPGAPLDAGSVVREEHHSKGRVVHDVLSSGAPDALRVVHEEHPNKEENKEGNLARASAHATPTNPRPVEPPPCAYHPGGDTGQPCAGCAKRKKDLARYERELKRWSDRTRATWPTSRTTGQRYDPGHSCSKRTITGECVICGERAPEHAYALESA